jgi:methylthioribulose-1-phosphate dehydratase
MSTHLSSLSTQDRGSLEELIGVIHTMHARGESPATSGNYSYRLHHESMILISESGVDKGALTLDHLIGINATTGAVFEPWAAFRRRSSAEMGLHLMVYAETDARCVLHSHAVTSLWFCDLHPDVDQVEVSGLEILKAFPGVNSHTESVSIPVFSNDQDIELLAERARQSVSQCPGFLIRGHGLTCWGSSVSEAQKYLEAFNYLFTYYTQAPRAYGGTR